MVSLNLGCGSDYRDNMVNLDRNNNVKADVYCDVNLNKPFPDGYFDFVYANNVLEHLIDIGLYNVFDMVCDGGVIHAIVPHCMGRHAFNDPEHKAFYNLNTFYSRPYRIFDVVSLRVHYCFGSFVDLVLPNWFVRLHERFLPGVCPPSHIDAIIKKKKHINKVSSSPNIR